MTDDRRWQNLQKLADRLAKEKLLDALLTTTGLAEYIADAIADHERQYHDAD